jgi:glycine oxidase
MVIVLGGGLIGLGIAYELAKRGERVRLIESRTPGRAASWAGAGMLAPFTEAMASQPFAAFCEDSLARYPAFVRELHECGGVDARLRLDGILEAAYDAQGEERLRTHVRTLAARGLPARYLEREEAREREPAFGPALRGASLCANEGAVDNRRLGRALHAACLATGVRVDVEAGDVTLEADARRVLGVRTSAGFAPADVVVNATGAWAAELRGVPVAHRIPVVPVKGQMLALAMPRGLVRHVVWAPGAYLVPRDDGRLLVGASVEDAGRQARGVQRPAEPPIIDRTFVRAERSAA